MGKMHRRNMVATTLAVALLLATATPGRARVGVDPDRARLERHLTGLPAGDTVPGPVAKAVAATIPRHILDGLRLSTERDADGMIGFLFGAARSPFTGDTTLEEWAIYAGDGEWGYLWLFSRQGAHVRRLAGRTWTVQAADSLVRVAPPRIRFHRADHFGLEGFIIRIDGLLDVAGNQSEEVLRWDNARLDHFTEALSGRARREGGLAQTRLEFEDADGDRTGRFVVYPAADLPGKAGKHQQTPLRVFKYNPKQKRFIGTDPPPAQTVD